MTKRTVDAVLDGTGAVLIVAGVALVWVPAAVILAGVALIVIVHPLPWRWRR